MADKKAEDKNKAKKSSKMHGYFIMLFIVILCIVFAPTMVVISVGMVPFYVAFFVDPSKLKFKAITVGCFNFLGTLPFLYSLWSRSNSLDAALEILFDPITMVMIYCAAAVGYLVDWAVVSGVSAFMYNRGSARLKFISKRKKVLVERWGEEVAGEAVVHSKM